MTHIEWNKASKHGWQNDKSVSYYILHFSLLLQYVYFVVGWFNVQPSKFHYVDLHTDKHSYISYKSMQKYLEYKSN